MEEGCNLYLDKDDIEKIKESLESGREYQIDPELFQYYKDDIKKTELTIEGEPSYADPKIIVERNKTVLEPVA